MKVIYGKDDVAGSNISYFLERNFSVDVIPLDEHPIYHDFPEKVANAKAGELIIVPSQHKSLKNIRSLTIHSAGNFDTDDYGGRKFKMAPTDARFARGVLLNVNKYGRNLGFEITYEATHHGPYSENPLLFVEIGSSEMEYGDRDIGYLMARSIYESYDEEATVQCGIGGTHYSSKFTNLALKEGIAFGHIASKYRFASITPDSLSEMFNKTIGAEGFLIDGKSFDSLQKNSIKKMLESRSFSYRFV
ncbi:MAG: D-aminoacyl-tRNA deacylase [Candidatus Thermoplasmatota archaeon]|jgi:D-aminoacyl-tRNA deacylase|nr:D-aminoacyl-tRNA deacylase [Candidatus Thermoplasmatota archaeon]MCL5788926.1 D-aminoacyl-tRNA deacylase [Candidatus Thermoplasmatota archaeon]